MTLRLYDTATRAVRDFVPVVPGEVSIYHCGLTVQSAPHLGHIRKEVVFDVLRRWLRYHGYAVTVIANVTDIDDKILAKAAEAGVPWFAHAYRFERELHDAYAALGCEPPTYEPRATGHIPEMIELIKTLVERGHAYPAEDDSGDVYFDVRSWPAYGSLSGQRVEDMEPAEDADPRGKRDPADFALWKGHKVGEPATASWWTPWGRGRPGWHLECSAMAGKYLGDEFDIHGGGIDLRFPHHENELAQSTAAGQRFARYWMHNAWVTAAGEKMSKSLGNGALVSEVTRAYPARAVRLYLASPHYRSAIEFSDESLTEATAALARIDGFVDRASELVAPEALRQAQGTTAEPGHPFPEPGPPLPEPGPPFPEPGPPSPEPGPPFPEPGHLFPEPVEGRRTLPEAFIAAMDDDLATPAAVAVVYAEVREGNAAVDAGDLPAVASHLARVTAMLGVLGLDADDPSWAHHGADESYRPVVDGLMAALLAQRDEARARKDYASSDAIRDAVHGLGITLEDTPRGARWSLTRKS